MTLPTPRKPTLAQWTYRWLGDHESRLQPSTYDFYKRATNKHVLPFFGDTKIGSIEPEDIHRFVAWLGETQYLSLNTQRSVLAVLRASLSYADLLRYIPTNPTSGIIVRVPMKEATRG